MARNPLETDPAREHHIREVAYQLWEADGKPHGHDVEFWERARELVGMEESAGSGQISPATPPQARIEEAELEENLGEFPGQLTDQGDTLPTPKAKRRPRATAKKA